MFAVWQNAAMNQFSLWLTQNPGMATTVAKALGINRSSVSNCKTGRRPMPPEWMDVIVRLSKGKLTHKTLIAERNRLQAQKAASAIMS